MDTPQPSPQPPQPPQGQQQQVRLHAGVYPQPDGTWLTGVWFIGFPTEGAAHHLAGQLEILIKNAFSPTAQPPQPQANGQDVP